MKIRCLKCGDTIESTSRHDLVYCKCGSVAVDGGGDYLRIILGDRIQKGRDYEVIE